MTMTVETRTDYRDLPIDWLVESPSNPRQSFSEDAMKEIAESIRANGVLQPLLVRPVSERRFEIVFGARRFRGSLLAEKDSVPVCIREMTDAQVLEAQLVENLQRQDVHPLDEAQGFAALLRLDEPKYSIEVIAAKCGKSAGYVASRLRLTELAPATVEAFTKDEIGLGHALLLAKLQQQQQKEALAACWQEGYSSSKPKRILLPVRHLKEWIEHNILLELASAPFSREDAALVPNAGSCVECSKRTGHNTLLFEGIASQHDSCSDPDCYQTKVDAHVKQTVANKPKLVQISTSFGKPAEGSPVVPRNQYVEIREEKPKNKFQREAPEYKTCQYTTEAIVSEGVEKGELRKVCANPDCPVHHPKKQRQQVNGKADAAFRAQQEKQRREEAIANTIGIRTLAAISAAVPVRLMKRDLLFVAERLAALVDERRLEILAKQRGIKRAKDSESIGKLFSAYLRRAEEGALGSILVELTILLTAARQQTAQVLKDAAAVYKVDIDAVAGKVKQEFAAKDRAKTAKKTTPKPQSKTQTKPGKKLTA